MKLVTFTHADSTRAGLQVDDSHVARHLGQELSPGPEEHEGRPEARSVEVTQQGDCDPVGAAGTQRRSNHEKALGAH